MESMGLEILTGLCENVIYDLLKLSFLLAFMKYRVRKGKTDVSNGANGPFPPFPPAVQAPEVVEDQVAPTEAA